jgi:type II secretory pathway component PulK
MRRAVVDTMIVRNRDDAQRASALARGGIRLATALLLEDHFAKQIYAVDPGSEALRFVTPGNTMDDLWSVVSDFEFVDPQGGRMRIDIRDGGALLNVNAVVPYTGEAAPVSPEAEEFLVVLLEKVIDEMSIDPGEKVYDPRELARNLIDWMDADDTRVVGGGEDDYYLGLDPPYRPPNGPLTSVEEIGLVEGFDVQLVEALRRYVTVFPIIEGRGVNLNTAPPHVLALIWFGVGVDRRLVDAGTVGRIMRMRDEGRIVCTASIPNTDCVTLSEVDLGEGNIFPPVELPDRSTVYTVRVRATVGEIERTVTAAVDVGDLTSPQLLFWRTQ